MKKHKQKAKRKKEKKEKKRGGIRPFVFDFHRTSRHLYPGEALEAQRAASEIARARGYLKYDWTRLNAKQDGVQIPRVGIAEMRAMLMLLDCPNDPFHAWMQTLHPKARNAAASAFTRSIQRLFAQLPSSRRGVRELWARSLIHAWRWDDDNARPHQTYPFIKP